MSSTDFDIWIYLAQVAPVVVVMAVVGRIMYIYFTRQLEKLEQTISNKDKQIESLNEKRSENDRQTITTLQHFSGLMDRLMEMQRDGSDDLKVELKEHANSIKVHIDAKILELRNVLGA